MRARHHWGWMAHLADLRDAGNLPRLQSALDGTIRVPRSGTRDAKRQAVYTAERAALCSHPVASRFLPDVAACQAYADAILADGRFRRRWPNVARLAVVGCPRMGRSATYCNGTIRVGLWGRRPWVLLHEIAHACADTWPAHGRDFVTAYLELVGLFLGADARQALRRELRARKVPWRGTDLDAWKRRQLAICRLVARRKAAATP